MLTKFLIRLVIAFYHFLLPPFCIYQYMLFPVILFKIPIYHKEISLMIYVLAGDGIQITFAERQMVNTVQHSCFSNTVWPNQTIYFGIKFKSCRIKILIIYKGNCF